MGKIKDTFVILRAIANHIAEIDATLKIFSHIYRTLEQENDAIVNAGEMLERIAIALEPTPKPEKRTREMPFEKVEKVDEMLDAGATYREIEAVTGVPKSTIGRMNNARERSGKFKQTGLYGLDSFKKYGISVGKAADFCKTVGIPVHRINNHGYISAGLAEYVIEKLGTK